MAFGGDVDTLSLTFGKLQYIFNGYGQILDSFLEVNVTYKQGKITNKDFFDKIQEGVMRFSALEFLAIKAIFEIKKSLDRNTRIDKIEGSSISVQELSHQSHSIASFVIAGTLPRPSHMAPSTRQEPGNCLHCGIPIKINTNFCTNCGNKL
ncbi:MAG: hypothetical protein ACREBB_03525 [Nitrosotalea sp.]